MACLRGNKYQSTQWYRSLGVQQYIKNKDRSQLLFETSVEELISQLVRLYNDRQKVDGFVKITSLCLVRIIWNKNITALDSYFLRVNAVYRLLLMLHTYYGNVKSLNL